MKITLSKSQWELIGNKAGWMKKAQIISGDGFADGGERYTDEELDLMEKDEIQKIKLEIDRPKKIKDLCDLYVKIHPNASGYEMNTLWNDIGQMSTEQINEYIDKYAANWGKGENN